MKRKLSLKIRISFFALLMLIALTLSNSSVSFAALIAAALHELGHIFAAKIFKTDLGELNLGIFGASLSLKGAVTSYKAEMAVAFFGPLANLLCVLLVSLFSNASCTFLQTFSTCSLFLAILNLLPISDLDGGRILLCFLSLFLPCYTANKILKICSFCIVFSLWCLSVYLLLRLGASLSLFVFSSALFCKVFIKSNTAD